MCFPSRQQQTLNLLCFLHLSPLPLFFALYPEDDEDGKAPTQPLLKKGRQCILGFVNSLSFSLYLPLSLAVSIFLCLVDCQLRITSLSSVFMLLFFPLLLCWLLFLYSTMCCVILGKSVLLLCVLIKHISFFLSWIPSAASC